MIDDIFDRNLMGESDDDFEPSFDEEELDDIGFFRTKRLYVAS